VWRNRVQHRNPRSPKLKLPCKSSFSGCTFPKKEDVKFKRIAVHYSHLDEWVHITGFEIIRPTDKKGIMVNYLLPDSIEMTEFEGWKMSIEIKAEGPRIPYRKGKWQSRKGLF